MYYNCSLYKIGIIDDQQNWIDVEHIESIMAKLDDSINPFIDHGKLSEKHQKKFTDCSGFT